MKKLFKNYFFILFLLGASSVHAQENLLYLKILKAKSSATYFKIIPSAFKLIEGNKVILDNFLNLDEVCFLEYDKSTVKNLSAAISLTVPLKNEELELELLEVSSSFYNYKVVTSDGKRFPANKSIRHYRGIVKGNPKSVVAITFTDSEVMGLIATDEGNFNLIFDNRLGQYIFYNDKNLKQKPKFECGMSDSSPSTYTQEVLGPKLKSASTLISKCVTFYFETEYDILQTLGSVPAVEEFVAAIYNQVATLYQNENIVTGLSEIYVWTTTDPYTAGDYDGLLTQFQEQRTSFNGDLGFLQTFRNIGGGKAAGYDGICNSNVAQKLAVSMLDNYYQNVPNYSWSVYTVTHELGHLFGSHHTSSCVWNGNNTAIDGCAIPVGCPNPGIPSNGGTIMSYCWAQSVGINFNLGFGPQPGSVIRNHVENATCLSELTGSTLICSSGTEYTVNNLPSGATITWSKSDNIDTVSVQGSNPCEFKANADGDYGYIRATITYNTNEYTIQKNVFVGAPKPPEYMYYDQDPLCVGNVMRFCVNEPGNPEDTYYTWYISPGDIAYINDGQGTRCIDVSAPYNTGYIQFTVASSNECGSSDYFYSDQYYIDNCYYKFSLYPNPASDNLKIVLPEIPDEAASMELYNSQSIKIMSTNLKGKETTIDISKLQKGVYYITVFSRSKGKNKVSTERFVKE